MEQRSSAEAASRIVVRVRELVVAATEVQDGAEGRSLLESALVELEVLRERIALPASEG